MFRYDPYEKKITEELYDHERMRKTREQSVSEASKAGKFGLILGTLGRQGSNKVLDNLQVWYNMYNLDIEQELKLISF